MHLYPVFKFRMSESQELLRQATQTQVLDTFAQSSHDSMSQVPSIDGEMRHRSATDIGTFDNDRPKPLDVDYADDAVDEVEGPDLVGSDDDG